MRYAFIAIVVLFTASAAWAEDKTVSFPQGKDAVLKLTAPQDAKISMEDGKTTIDTAKGNVYLWLAPKAKTIDEAVKGIGDIVKSEVKDVKVNETKTIKVAGTDAKQLMAKTTEADDGDDGTSAFVVFKFDGKVIVACVHGEGEAASRQLKPMLDILATSKKP